MSSWDKLNECTISKQTSTEIKAFVIIMVVVSRKINGNANNYILRLSTFLATGGDRFLKYVGYGVHRS